MADNPEHLTKLIADRVTSYPRLVMANIVGIVANLWLILSYGPTASTPAKCAILLSVIAVALICSLPARSLFADIDAFRKDLASTQGQSAYGRELASKPLSLFVALTVGFNALIVVVQAWALFGS